MCRDETALASAGAWAEEMEQARVHAWLALVPVRKRRERVRRKFRVKQPLECPLLWPLLRERDLVEPT